jgi:hypothetical protein
MVMMVGCRQQMVVYSHTDKGDVLVTESRGDNIDDYGSLRMKAEELCRNEGYKSGITVLNSGPGNASRDSGFGTYGLTYKCNGQDPGMVDKIVTAYKKVTQ